MLAARRATLVGVAAGACALACGGCASEAPVAMGAPATAPPRSTLAFALPASSISDSDAQAIATRNNDALSPQGYPELSTTSWPEPGRRHELRRVPIIYSRWGRSF